MDVAQLKYNIIEKLIRTEDERLLEKIDELMRSVPAPYPENDLKPMTVEELQERITQAEKDVEEGRVHTTAQVKRKLGL